MEIVATYVPAPGCDPAGELARPPAGATMVELRADLLGADLDLAPLVAASPLPVILTLRSRAEGGEGSDDPGARRRFFESALALPVALVDLEAARDAELVGAVVLQDKVILSAHVAGESAAALEQRAAELIAAPARFVKLVAHAGTTAEVMAVLHLAVALDRGSRKQRRAIVFAAGEAGRATRLLSPLLGAPLAFAAWSGDRPAAPGQYTPAEMISLTRHLAGRPRRVFALLAGRAGATLSPTMHNAAFAALGLPNLFVPLSLTDPAELDLLLRPAGETALDDAGLSAGGFAVTMPLKGEAARRCTLLAPRAARAGVVNTVLPRHEKVLGDCTDIDGITRVLAEEGVDLAGKLAVVLGTGGAARAAVVAVELAGASAGVIGRDATRAAALAGELGTTVIAAAGISRAAVLINATPAGIDGGDDEFLSTLGLAAGTVVIDLPYGDQPTTLERLAPARGWRYVSGREVLLFQGVSQFAAMNGVAPPVRAMAAALGLEEVQA